MRKMGKKIGCMVMSAALLFTLDVGTTSLTPVQAAETYNVSTGDISDIQAALDRAKSTNSEVVVNVKGTYTLGSEPLHIYSDTHLILDSAATIKRGSGSNIMIKNGWWNENAGGYNLSKNITIEGGTWDGSGSSAQGDNNLYFGHASNITIKNTTLKNGYGEHIIELTGVKDSKVENVTFDGFIGSRNGDNAYKEALQLDYTSEKTSSAFAPYDNTACANITVKGCTFNNYPSGVGSHSYTDGVKHVGINISNNIFKDISNVAIDAQNYTGAIVNGNTVSGTNDRFIAIGNSTVAASDNKINGAGSYGYFVERDSVASISGGYVNNANDSAVFAQDGSALTVDSVAIAGSKNAGIFAKNSVLDAKNNSVSNSGGVGIYVQNPSGVTEIKNNAITSSGYAGVQLDAGNKATVVSSNTIKTSGTYGIVVFGASGSRIDSNTVNGYGEYGIYVRESGASVRSNNVDVSGNKVSGGPSAIVLRNTDAGTVKNNTANASNFGIYINANCSKTKVSGNTYTGVIGVYDTTASFYNNTKQNNDGTLKRVNGKWSYVVENVVDNGYTGLCKYSGKWWYVKNGTVDFGYTGLCKYNGTWWYVKSGAVDFGYTGLCKYNGSWWYVKSGAVNFGYTGLCKYNGSWWYVHGGRVDFGSTTLVQYAGSWWYVSGGYVRFSATGLCKYNGTWWYVYNGKVNFNSTTLVKYNGSWWYVSGGYVRFGATGLCSYNGRWWYVQSGRVNFGYTGLCKYNGRWWYVQNGVLNFGYTGYTTYHGTTYRVVNGILA